MGWLCRSSQGPGPAAVKREAEEDWGALSRCSWSRLSATVGCTASKRAERQGGRR